MSRSTRKFSIVIAAVAASVAGTAVVTSALADDPPTAAFVTVDTSEAFSRTAGTGASSTNATIVTGGKVTFTNPPGAEPHDVDFNGKAGVNCTQTAGGTATGTIFPVPPVESAWAGECTFTQAGSYPFVCTVHAPDMRGTVTVTDPTPPGGGTPPPPPPPPPPGGGTTPPPPVGPGATTPPPPPTVTANLAIKVGASQRGSGVSGTITGAKRLGNAKITVSAKRGDVGVPGRKTSLISVGSRSASLTKTGGLDFIVSLNAKARAALAKRGRLALVVKVTVDPATGAATAKKFNVVLKPIVKRAKTASVTLKNNLFTPSNVELARGGTVTWTWKDGTVPHDVVGTGFKAEIQSKGTFKHTFKRAGTFKYVCTLHDGMEGVVRVK